MLLIAKHQGYYSNAIQDNKINLEEMKRAFVSTTTIDQQQRTPKEWLLQLQKWFFYKKVIVEIGTISPHISKNIKNQTNILIQDRLNKVYKTHSLDDKLKCCQDE